MNARCDSSSLACRWLLLLVLVLRLLLSGLLLLFLLLFLLLLLLLLVQILEGEKASAVHKRGNVYSATLVAFPAAQVANKHVSSNIGIGNYTFIDPMHICIYV